MSPDPHRALLDRLALLRRLAACEADAAKHEELVASAVDVERQIAATPADTVAGCAAQVELALSLLDRDADRAVLRQTLETVLATLSWPAPEAADNAQRRRLGRSLDVMAAKVQLLIELTEELITDVRDAS